MKALFIMETCLPADHLFLASTKRVLALIYEEIAIDHMTSPSFSRALLERSEEHTLFALNITCLTFGEFNSQPANLYGNLGRLYQVRLLKRYNCP